MAVDLKCRYLGLELENPLVVSACPMTADIEALAELQLAGAAAAVLPSLFEEQIEHDQHEMSEQLGDVVDPSPEAPGYFTTMSQHNYGPGAYLSLIEEAKREVSMPIIASLNASEAGGWVHYAELIEDAGADALELNLYFVPTTAELSSEAVERRYIEIVRAVRRSVKIPLAVKIGPFFSALPSFAARVVEAGADGLVLFNRFLEPDVDVETLTVRPSLELSRASELRLALRWIGILRGQLDASLAANSGIHSGTDMVKAIACGADVTLCAATFLENGTAQATQMLAELSRWLGEHELDSVDALRGRLGRHALRDPSLFERSNYTHALVEYTGA